MTARRQASQRAFGYETTRHAWQLLGASYGRQIGTHLPGPTTRLWNGLPFSISELYVHPNPNPKLKPQLQS